MSSDGDGSRPLKRKKVHEEGPSDNLTMPSSPVLVPLALVDHSPDAKWTRHAQYYFDDGSIVLLAEGTIFRVHKGVLILHSGFFKHILDGPQELGTETVDGCPLVRIKDSVGSLEWLLEIMYRGDTTPLLHRLESSHFTVEAKDIETLYRLSSIGNKYDVQSLLDHVYQQLRQIFPPIESVSLYSLRDTLQRKELCLVVKMIRVWHPRATHLLPLVFYHLCRLPQEQGVAGMICGGQDQLSPEDIQRCLLAIPKLLAHKLRICNVFTTPTQGAEVNLGFAPCETLAICPAIRSETSHRILEKADQFTIPDPLEKLTFPSSPWKRVCPSCAKSVKEEISRLREATWKDLGKIFDVPEWRIDGERT